MGDKGVDIGYSNACNDDRFCSFVQRNNEYNGQETNHLQQVILNKKLTKILKVSGSLAIWSMLAAWIDAVVLPILIVYAIALPGAIYYPILFPIVWTILNATFKFIFIHKKLGSAITLRDNFLAVLPYAGAAFLLKNWFVGDPLLKRASIAYIAYQKKLVVQKMFSVFRPLKLQPHVLKVRNDNTKRN